MIFETISESQAPFRTSFTLTDSRKAVTMKQLVGNFIEASRNFILDVLQPKFGKTISAHKYALF
jgi:hypothetical protein